MRKNISFVLVLIISFTFTYFGCKDSITGSQLDSKTIPDYNVSFSQNLQPVLEIKCASSGCHDDGTRAGGLSLTTWANTTADPSVVFPGKPENSKLVWAIQRQPAVSPMPPDGYAPLTAAQIKGIITWIKEGAKNN